MGEGRNLQANHSLIYLNTDTSIHTHKGNISLMKIKVYDNLTKPVSKTRIAPTSPIVCAMWIKQHACQWHRIRDHATLMSSSVSMPSRAPQRLRDGTLMTPAQVGYKKHFLWNTRILTDAGKFSLPERKCQVPAL